MALTSSITVLFNCLLLLSLFVLASIAASIPANKPDDYSDLPFEFNPDRGTTVVEDNVLTQAVSSNGKTVLATNDPQPIKKYNFNNNNDNNANTANYVNDSDNSNDNNNNNNNNDSKKPKMQSLNPNQKEQLQSNKQQFGKKQGFNRLTSNNGVYTTTYMSPMQMNQLFYENFSSISVPTQYTIIIQGATGNRKWVGTRNLLNKLQIVLVFVCSFFIECLECLECLM